MYKAILHYYYLTIDNKEGEDNYLKLQKDLTSKGYQLFDSVIMNHGKFYKDKIRPLDGQEITIETKHLFKNQWNTVSTETSESGLRLFDWAEAIFPNKDVKEGYWLEFLFDVKEFRKAYLKCNYCGRSFLKSLQFGGECPYCERTGYLERLI